MWEEVCHPLLLTTGTLPPIRQLLQLRLDRRQMSIFDFKDEVAKPLTFFGFLDGLRDESLTAGSFKTAVLNYYRKSLSQAVTHRRATVELEAFVIDVCIVIVVEKAVKSDGIAIQNVLSTLAKGAATLEKLTTAARQSVAAADYAEEVILFLEDEKVLAESAAVVEASQADVSSEADDYAEDDADLEVDDELEADGDLPETDSHESELEASSEGDDAEPAAPMEREEEVEAEIEVADFNLMDDEEEDEADDEEEDDEPTDFISKFRAAMKAIYKVQTARDRSIKRAQRVELMRARIDLISRFDPLHAVVPSLEEAQAMVEFTQTTSGTKRIHRPVLKSAPARGEEGEADRSAVQPVPDP